MQATTTIPRASTLETGRGLAASLASLLRRLGRDRALRQAFRRTVAELDACSERDLHDLGIARCDIPRIAREAVYGNAAGQAG